MTFTKLLRNKVGAVALITAAGCGDVYNSYNYGSGAGDSSSNGCGDSPVYGRHLWEISGCRWGMTMKEDCSVDVLSISKEDDDMSASYRGLDITFNGLGTYTLFPDVRFPEKYQSVNDKLDQYDGYWMNIGPQSAPDDNAFVTLDIPYPGSKECKDSQYYSNSLGDRP